MHTHTVSQHYLDGILGTQRPHADNAGFLLASKDEQASCVEFFVLRLRSAL